MKISPHAGKPATQDMLIDVTKLIDAYYKNVPDPAMAAQKVSFGTSGHRGCSFASSFNEWHILAISQAICQYRKQNNIDGPLFMGFDTHAVSKPAFNSAIEVLTANGVDVIIADNDGFTPTPVISHAILTYNNGRTSGLADGIVITPSHNPPQDGGFKYNPPNGGPAGSDITGWIEKRANEFLENKLSGISRMPFEKAIAAGTVHRRDFIKPYVSDLKNIVNMDIIRDSKISIGVDPLGGAGVHYWQPIADMYGLNMRVVNKEVDPTFAFMTQDWDGQIRMDPSSPYAMASLIEMKDKFDISFACDTDHDRHGIVTKSKGLMPPNHYLSVAILYLFQYRPHWHNDVAIGKTLVSSSMIDKVAAKLGRKLYEVPVGFKWFVDGLLNGSLGFVGEESAGAVFSRMNGNVWTTDKDGFVPALLSAEITATLGKDPAQIYAELEQEFGHAAYERIEAPATPAQKKVLSKLSAEQITAKEVAGEEITKVLTSAPGNNALIGGVKVVTEGGWFAARPSGTESIYKIYAESFKGEKQLDNILKAAQKIVDEALNTTIK